MGFFRLTKQESQSHRDNFAKRAQNDRSNKKLITFKEKVNI